MNSQSLNTYTLLWPKNNTTGKLLETIIILRMIFSILEKYLESTTKVEHK